MTQYFLITLCTNFSLKKDTSQHHQLALGLSAEWGSLGDGWIPPLFWFSEPSLHDGALSPRSVPGGSWERASPARLQRPSLWSSGTTIATRGLTPALLTCWLVIVRLQYPVRLTPVCPQPITSGVSLQSASHPSKTVLLFFLEDIMQLITSTQKAEHPSVHWLQLNFAVWYWH